MGAGYHGGFGKTKGAENKPTYTIEQNANAMKKYYPMTSAGKFGIKGENQRVIYSNDQFSTAKDFYARISRGGTETLLPANKGLKNVLCDGTIIIYRVITKTANSPAVQIFISKPGSVAGQKIHFLKEK